MYTIFQIMEYKCYNFFDFILNMLFRDLLHVDFPLPHSARSALHTPIYIYACAHDEIICFANLGGGSAVQRISSGFSLHCSRLALLCFAKLGGGSAGQRKSSGFSLPCTRLALLCFAKLGGGSAVQRKSSGFSLHCTRLALTLLRQVRRRLGSAKKILRLFFALHSPCTNFASPS